MSYVFKHGGRNDVGYRLVAILEVFEEIQENRISVSRSFVGTNMSIQRMDLLLLLLYLTFRRRLTA